MKKPSARLIPRAGRAACTVSAAALMLGVSQAATVGLHFQPDWTENNTPSYTGFPVTATAFGIAPEGWENLTPVPTGYNGSGNAPGPFTFAETIDTTTATLGLHPLPRGSLSVTWTAVAANTSGFAGNDPGYGGNHPHVGEQEVYYGFLRDDVFIYTHPDSSPGYSVKITGLKSLFPTSQYVVQLVAATDSGNSLADAIVTGDALTQNLSYSATRTGLGIMGGVSSASTALGADSIVIKGSPALKDEGNGIFRASTISGILITDKPLVTAAPKTPASPFLPGDSAALSVSALGVPPLQYQWRRDGVPVPGATATTYTVANVGPANSGHYDVVVSNAYGSVTSDAAAVTAGILVGARSGIFADTSGPNASRHADDLGATQLATSKDSAGKTRSGVAVFSAANPGLVRLAADTNFDSTVGTISFWLRSAGTVVDEPVSTGNKGAVVFDRRGNSGLLVVQKDDGTLSVQPDGSGNAFGSVATVADNNWHHIAITIDQSATGDVSLYIDGLLDSGNSGNTNPWSWPTGQSIRLGLGSDGYWRPYDGQLDDFRIYNRVLTDAEIASVNTSDAVVDSAALKVRLNFSDPSSSGLSLDWLSGGLQASDALAGGFGDLPATSPFAILPTAAQKFYRTQR